MNAHGKIDHEIVITMTSDGYVQIPKTLRDQSGLGSNGQVRVGINDRGETVILPPLHVQVETPEQRKAQFRKGLLGVKGTLDLGGMTTDQFMRELRGDWEP